MEAELVTNLGDVALDRPLGKKEAGRDFPVGEAAADEIRDLVLTPAEHKRGRQVAGHSSLPLWPPYPELNRTATRY